MYLIIGGSSDLANEIANKLIKYDDIIITYRTTSNLKRIKSKNNKKIIYKKLDLNNLQNIKKFILTNKKSLKKVKFINLATLSIDKLTHDLKLNDITNVFNVNLFSNILLS